MLKVKASELTVLKRMAFKIHSPIMGGIFIIELCVLELLG